MDIIKNGLKQFLNVEYIKLKKLEDYYLGKHSILLKENRRGKKKDPKVINNYPKTITTYATGYFMGKPVTYQVNDDLKASFEKLRDYLGTEEEQARNYSLAEYISIYGKSYELAYYNDNKELSFKELKPTGCFLIKDDSIEKEVIYGCRVSSFTDTDKKLKYHLELYDNTTIKSYVYCNDELTLITDSKPHGFSQVPIIEYVSNSWNVGDFEDVISLVDAYNELLSCNMCDIQDVSNAIMKIINASGTDDETITEIMKKGFVRVEGDGDAQWLTKDINDTYNENTKNTLHKNIHEFSLVPDLTDEQFSSNSSGIAIKYKTIGLEQLTAKKEIYFKESLNKRIELLIDELKLAGKIKATDIQKVFTRNLPTNMIEQAETAQKLTGIVSEKTILSNLSIVPDVEKELAQKESETQSIYKI